MAPHERDYHLRQNSIDPENTRGFDAVPVVHRTDGIRPAHYSARREKHDRRELPQTVLGLPWRELGALGLR